jgi:hypothetical protein
MRQIVIVSGVLGGGSALVFAAAAVVASAFPTGALVPTQGWNQGGFVRAMPGFRGGPIMMDDMSGGGWTDGTTEPEIDIALPQPEPVLR